jgi:hypothetical protein
MAKLVNMDTPNAKQPEDVKAQIAVQNAKEVQKILSRQGASQLVDFSSTASYATTSTTPVAIEALRQAFASGGGLLQIYFKATGDNGASGRVLTAALYLDGTKVDDCQLYNGAAGNILGTLDLFYQGVPASGKHVVDIYIATSGGAVSIGVNSTKVQLKVTETLL